MTFMLCLGKAIVNELFRRGSMDEDCSGPCAASLSAQLLIQMRKKRPGIDIAALGSPTEGTSFRDVRSNMKRIRRLLDMLADRDSVFLVLDSLVHLAGSDEQTSEVVRFVFGLIDDSRLVVKILATGIFLGLVLEAINHTTLFLPDFVDGGSQDINPAFFEGDTLQSIEEFEAQKEDEQDSTDAADEESETESEGWDY
ncbi:hypothetical protein BU26DRAFT_29070 [Trematosphaeria pertusa]|uniref:Uncharacterized protein n=1 Tax=Trematosphaeria pertusa TaxID=390896 RepID=A0A6A6J3H9_9PLEO|nr:uncharacterized protein BU26DRAFT_29070 [Trematosphaeria pertusa]KAF2256772.1 hypothetical protein BU26DRAFT_29070 [Trematosphaeria pertusa]